MNPEAERSTAPGLDTRSGARENLTDSRYTRLLESVKACGLQTPLPGFPAPYPPSPTIPDTAGALTLDQARGVVLAAIILFEHLETVPLPAYSQHAFGAFRDRMWQALYPEAVS